MNTLDQHVNVMGPTLRLALVVLLLCASLFGVAAVLDRGQVRPVPAGYTRVQVTLSDYHIAFDPSTPLAPGKVALVVTNKGRIRHELVMFGTVKGATQLPLRKDGDVNEESPLLRSVADSGDSLAPGQTKVILATLTAGHYVAVCNLAGHWHLGMRHDVTVS